MLAISKAGGEGVRLDAALWLAIYSVLQNGHDSGTAAASDALAGSRLIVLLLCPRRCCPPRPRDMMASRRRLHVLTCRVARRVCNIQISTPKQASSLNALSVVPSANFGPGIEKSRRGCDLEGGSQSILQPSDSRVRRRQIGSSLRWWLHRRYIARRDEGEG